jgi:hypothetical protein
MVNVHPKVPVFYLHGKRQRRALRGRISGLYEEEIVLGGFMKVIMKIFM